MNDSAETLRPTEPFREEHRHLFEHVEHLAAAARKVPELDAAQRSELVAGVLSFLRGTLIPHAKAEEQVLYPEWEKLVGFQGAAVPMIHDHESIAARIEQLEAADAGDTDTLQELLYGLYALISVHFHKEEDLQLPLFDEQSPEFVHGVIERMEQLSGAAHQHDDH